MRHLKAIAVITFFFLNGYIRADKDSDSIQHQYWLFEAIYHSGYIVENTINVPKSTSPFFFEFNPSIQTNGSKEWHHIFGLPEVGCSFYAGNLGNKRELGNIFGILPNMTFNTINRRWFSPKISLGIGLAFFNKPYNAQTDTANVYIGSHITAFAHVAVFIQPRLSDHFNLKVGVAVSHCSNGHYQVPNVGLNLMSVFAGVAYHPLVFPNHFEKRKIQVPPGKIKFNVRLGIGVHELARTLGPAGTPKYAIYSTDLFLSKRYGRKSNVQAGVEVNYYNSYYNYIVKNDFFTNNQKLKSTVMTVFLGHDLLIHHFSLLTQGGINVYNQFYNNYIKMYLSERGMKTELKKYISARLGVQYYFFDPNYCNSSNIYIGAYIKANFGQADFSCMQLGFVF